MPRPSVKRHAAPTMPGRRDRRGQRTAARSLRLSALTVLGPVDRPAERHFVGRHAELQALQQALQRAVAGQPGIALLAGEPGIGKTRTAQEMIAFAAQHEVLALWGRCPEEAGAPPYWPWVQLMRRWIALQDEAELARVFAAAAPLASLDPRFATVPAASRDGSRPRPTRRRPASCSSTRWPASGSARRSASRCCWCWTTCTVPTCPRCGCSSSSWPKPAAAACWCWAPTATPN